jgi:membrane associated rhomboid family serine protease
MPHRLSVTYAIAAVTTLAYLLVSLGYIPHADVLGGVFTARWSEGRDIPGALQTALTPLSATLLHGSLMHLGFNMLIFLYCGSKVESRIGGGKLLLLYIIGAYTSALTQVVATWHSDALMIGASGAISTIFGFYAMEYNDTNAPFRIPLLPQTLTNALYLGAFYIGLQIVMGLNTGGEQIAYWAHIGGFVTGLGIGALLQHKRESGAT